MGVLTRQPYPNGFTSARVWTGSRSSGQQTVPAHASESLVVIDVLSLMATSTTSLELEQTP